MRYKTILLGRISDEVIDQRLKIDRHLEMMIYLTSMKIAWDKMVSVHVSMFYDQRLLDGVLNNFAER